ncbi:MAG: hypothetical protein HY033_10525 [Ignavibacteriae bacterium]|nr:hypothetical protein [Ignavibacteria bacterium]MBI3365332.1 hypothetical protein [Ignavibacteriota bacterium]
MGSQQLLLYILGVVIILIVMATMVFLFREYEISSNKDAILIDLHTVVADIDQYCMRPATMGGGDGSYDGYTIPSRLSSNDNGTYAIAILAAPNKGLSHSNGLAKGFYKHRGQLNIIGTSKNGFGTVTLTLDDSASVSKLTFTGKFH